MDTAGLIMILIGIYLLDSAIKNRRPVELAKQVIEKPGSIRQTISSAEGYIAQGTVSTMSTGAIGTVVAFAKSKIGAPYVWGGTGDNNSRGGYDCSGLVKRAYESAGISIPRTTALMLASEKLRKINKPELIAGDLVFPFPGHVQLYIGDGMIIEAPGRGRNVSLKRLGTVWQARRVKELEGTTLA